MSPTEAAAKLQHFNAWRRGHHDDAAQPDPREIGEAIDAAVEMIDRLEAAEKERDELRAKIEAMEKQKPIGEMLEVSPHNYELRWYRPVPFGAKLYTLHGVKGEEK